MILAYVAALGCALCYGLGSVLQSIAAKRVEAGDRLDPRLLARVATQGPYLAGLGLDAAGWLLSLVALFRLPLFVVQAVVAASMGFVVLFSAQLEHHRPTARQLGFLAALGVGLLALAATGAPEEAQPAPAGFALAMWVAVAVVTLAGTLAPRFLPAATASAVLGALAGLAFGGSALCARSLATDFGAGTLRDPLAWAMVAFGAVGLGFYAAALQRGTVTVATAWLYTTETVAPAVVGLAVLGDHARAGLAGPAAVGFVITVVAAVGLTLVSPPLE
jgi:drug/metabolite transporter (DMT)-like permease